MDEQVTTDQITLMLDDLARRVAQTSLDAAQWRARAMSAEAALEELRSAAATEEE